MHNKNSRCQVISCEIGLKGPRAVLEEEQVRNNFAISLSIQHFNPALVLLITSTGMMSQELSQGAGERGELVHTLSKETPGSPDASELGSPRCTQTFDLFNMVVSYKRMALFLKPVTDAVELSSFLLGFVCMFACLSII